MKGNTRVFSVLSYITWLGFAASFIMHARGDHMVEHHLNQALVLNILVMISHFLSRRHGITGLAGDVIGLICLVLLIIGIFRGLKLSDEPLPLIGDIHILW